jgi:phosphoesterase RecJ-like protein
MPLNPAAIADARKAIESHHRLLIVPHANVDPDGLSSALACYSVFKALGKDCTVICPDTPPEALKFLPGFEHLSTSVGAEQEFVITLDCSDGVEVDKLRYTVEDNKVNIIVVPKKGKLKKQQVSILEGGLNYDLLVVVDSAELSLLGSVYSDNVDLFSEVPILNIDHHVSNTQFGQLHLIDATAASATEVLYGWFTSNEQWKQLITPDVATLLLTGLITDTRSFQNPNTTPKSLEVAANLLDYGARQQEIIKHIYKTKPLSTLKIWGRALNGIQIDPSARIVWSAISKQDLQEMGASSKETAGILDELISTIPDADVHVLFTETEDGVLKASLRSSPIVDVNMAAGRLFGGGGHARASGFKVKNYANFQLGVLECVQKLKEEIRRQREEANEPLPLTSAPTPKQREAAKTSRDGTATGASSIAGKPEDASAASSVDVVQRLGGA